MKLEDLVEIARYLVRSNSEEERNLGEGILDLLAEAAPCGWERPTVDSKGIVEVPATWVGATAPEDARHLARMLLRAADEAESAQDASVSKDRENNGNGDDEAGAE